MSRGEPLKKTEIVPVIPGVIGRENYEKLLKGDVIEHVFKPVGDRGFGVHDIIQGRGPGGQIWVPVEVLSLESVEDKKDPAKWMVKLKAVEQLQRWETSELVEDFDLYKQVTLYKQDPPKPGEEFVIVFRNKSGGIEERRAYIDARRTPINEPHSVTFRPSPPDSQSEV